MNAHIPTIFLMILLVSATLTVVVGVVAQGDVQDGLAAWAAGLLAHTLAYGLISLRGQWPDALSIVVANVLLSATFALYGEALCRFDQRRPPRAWLWLPVAATGATFTLLMHEAPARMVAGPLLFALQTTLLLHMLHAARRRTAGRGQYLVACGLLAMLPVYAARIVGVLAGDAQILHLTEASPLQTLTFIVTAISLLVATLGFVLMTKDQADARSRALAMVDDLTGLPNRRCTLQSFAQQVAQARRTGQPLAVLMIDVDHFKRINDGLGHLVGDAVLRHVAQGIRRRLRAQDLVGRFGGEEFLALLPDTDAVGGHQVAEDLRAGLAGEAHVSPGGQRVPATVSIGLATLDPGRDGESLLAAADAAMYEAKAAGRNRVRCAAGAGIHTPCVA